MKPVEKFQRIRDYIDSQNICDFLIEYMSDDELENLCHELEEEFDVQYDDEYEEYEY
jgi:hypothetical protein